MFCVNLLACLLFLAAGVVLVQPQQELSLYVPPQHVVKIGQSVLFNDAIGVLELQGQLISCLGADSAEPLLPGLYKAYGHSLDEIYQLSLPSNYEYTLRILSCAERVKGFDQLMELLYLLAIYVYPPNYAAYKNLAFIYEYNNFYQYSRYMYSVCHKHTLDVGCLLHNATVAPLVSYSAHESLRTYREIMAQLFRLLSTDVPFSPINDMYWIYHTFREQPLTLHYLGGDPSLPLHLFSLTIYKFLPILSTPAFNLPPAPPSYATSFRTPSAPVRTVRVGILAEYGGNSSPGLCLQDIFEALMGVGVGGQEGGAGLEMVFFDRPDLPTVFAWRMRTNAFKTVLLDHTDIASSSRLIRDERLDVLLVMALGTEKFSYLLSHMRLARVQGVVGIGHPLSGGIGGEGVDFTVLPLAMRTGDLRENSGVRIPRGSAAQCGMWAYHCELRGLSEACHDFAHLCWGWTAEGEHTDANWGAIHKGGAYTEQVVWFESLSYFLPDPLRYIADARQREILEKARYYRRPRGPWANHRDAATLSCAEIQEILDEIWPASSLRNGGKIAPLVAEDFGCQVNESPAPANAEVKVFFHLLQYIKKSSPFFDDVILGIIHRIRGRARFFVPQDYGMFAIPRLRKRAVALGLDLTGEMDLDKHFIEVPRIPHFLYLFLTSLCDVFLSPHPFGGGITSSEALGVCVPPLLAPSLMSVLPFTLGQVRATGLAGLAVQSNREFVDLAVAMADGAGSRMSDVCRLIVSGGQKDLYYRSPLDLSPMTFSECMVYSSPKDMVCARRNGIFATERITHAAGEWKRFLLRISQGLE